MNNPPKAPVPDLSTICFAGWGNFAHKLGDRLGKLGKIPYLPCRIYHPDPEKAQKNGSLGISDLEAALRDPMIQSFFVITPNDQHFGLLERVLKEGRHHVFVEKPITAYCEEALRLGDLVEVNKKVFMVGHNQRRESVFRKAKEILNSGKIGKVVSVYFNFSHGAAFHLPPDSWRASAKRHREGPLITLGSHCFDTLHYLLGPVESVSAVIQNLTGKTAAPDSNAVMMQMESGATVLLQADYNIPSEKLCLIHGTEGVISIDRCNIRLRLGRDFGSGAAVLIDRKPTGYEEILVATVDAFEEELKEFFAAIDGNARVETGYAEALNVMMVLECCVQSNKERRAIRVRELFPSYYQ